MAWETAEQKVHAPFLNSRRQSSKPEQDSSSEDLCSASATIPANPVSYNPLPPGQSARGWGPWVTSWCSDTGTLQLPKRWCPAPQPHKDTTRMDRPDRTLRGTAREVWVIKEVKNPENFTLYKKKNQPQINSFSTESCVLWFLPNKKLQIIPLQNVRTISTLPKKKKYQPQKRYLSLSRSTCIVQVTLFHKKVSIKTSWLSCDEHKSS